MKNRREITQQTKSTLKDTGNSDRETPSLLTRGKNLGKAVVEHVKNKCEFVEIVVYEARIDICNTCDMRNGRICTHPSCGCYLDEKCWWESEKCPLGKWSNNG